MSQFFGGNTTGQGMAWLHGARLGLGGTVRSGLAWAVYSGEHLVTGVLRWQHQAVGLAMA